MLMIYRSCNIVRLSATTRILTKQMVLTMAEGMQKAITTARTVTLFVRMMHFGNYTMTYKQTHPTATVTSEKRNRARLADCDYKARGYRCYNFAVTAAHI